jgi:FixJ family two-component response regulator
MPQQREVALLIAARKSNREIADDLGLSFNKSSHVNRSTRGWKSTNDPPMARSCFG